MIRKAFLVFFFSYAVLFCQQLSNTSISFGDKDYLLPSYNLNGSIYITLTGIADVLGLEYVSNNEARNIVIKFSEYELEFIANNPYVIKKSISTNKVESIQIPTSIHLLNKTMFVPLKPSVEVLNELASKTIVIISPNKLYVSDNVTKEENKLWTIKLNAGNQDSFLKMQVLKFPRYIIRKTVNDELYILLLNITKDPDAAEEYSFNNIVEKLELLNDKNNLVIKIKPGSQSIAYEVIKSPGSNQFIVHFFNREESDWYEKESEHFKLIYKQNHAHLANHILSCAENSLQRLSAIFDYKPTEKIIINTYDVSDYGFGATTNVPQNYIRLEIEAFEPGYEAISYNERIQWLLSHELVHIVVNDEESNVEKVIRNVFGKVPPEKIQPFTTIYSILGNFTRYTPRWYQEGIAVFIETWLSGGYGRTLGNFDEMYFRSLILEKKVFPSQDYIETILSHRSMFLENNYYFYGTRFVSYLAIHFGVKKVIDWFKTYPNQFFIGYSGKFDEVFGKNINEVWQDFTTEEKSFQEENIKALKSSKLTEIKKLRSNNFGWVTQPYFDSKTLSITFGYHRPANLATIQKFHLLTRNSEDFATLTTPSMYQVASTAFDESNNLFFYTTNNNKLFRDVWVLDLFNKEEKILFPDSRIGNITVSAKTHDLWGVQQQGGLSTLVVSEYPYQEINQIHTLDFGNELSHLSISKSGTKLAAVLHRASGEQSIILFNTRDLMEGNKISLQVITSDGSPENPSWSRDEKSIYWNAYTNGVSNIYRYDFSDSTVTALTHCLSGLFKPIEISSDSIFAFEFTTDGFYPVMVANQPAHYLPAIQYYGQKILDKDPVVYNWVLKDADQVVDQSEFTYEQTYNGLENLHLHSLVPVVSGFQNQIVFGLFSRVSDPLLLHDFYIELGISPLKEIPSYPFWHLKLKYDYRQRFYFEYSFNGPEFFDIFNSRKRGMIGSKYKIGHTHYWLYDKPHTIKQEASFTFFSNVEYINDNLVRVSEPDFSVVAYNITSQNLRRTIGSSDYEYGEQTSLTFTLYSTNFNNIENLLNGYLEYDRYGLWLADHNVAHLKLAGGYMLDNEKVIQGRFYFGGFGNRGVDNDVIRQFRRVFRFPGIPIYDLMTDRFIKLMIENAFPPIRVSGWEISDQYVNHFDFSIYSQSLLTKSRQGNYWINVGAQFDIKFKHWYNLESTFSAGIAKAWSEKMTDWQWFLSLKLLKD